MHAKIAVLGHQKGGINERRTPCFSHEAGLSRLQLDSELIVAGQTASWADFDDQSLREVFVLRDLPFGSCPLRV